MGASESILSKQSPVQQSQFVDEITTVSQRIEGVDPLLERIRALKIATPLLKSPQSESSLTDILLKKPSSASGTLDPNVLLELFSIYREWQEKKAKKISQKQEELENKIETVDALAAKLLQRFTHSVAAMRSTSQSLAEVYPLQVEVGELKGRLNEVISNCDALCKRISSLGPEALGATVTPFAPSIARKEESSLPDNKLELSNSDVQ
ncbi:hypothetical protein LUZ63_001573 [Rhynchospora breviuscula]|uniref:Uncharacterized protein n=1 Tax=Rhynchospora breviuscula TaxID=2022672 RepID=A0A9Q0CYG6_9POAL|nr:hypothetical protein LUZ63_001573 [Rhynchospora breviuscula]